MNDHRTSSLFSAGMLLGIGLGGFIDGIVFHQILQTHNMLSAKYPVRNVDLETLVINLQVNMFWDGLFHVFTWLMTALGITLLWRTARRPSEELSTRYLLGAILLGFGSFNLIEGGINHHILHLHHVVEGANHLPWDLGFLASGLILAIVGCFLLLAGRGECVPVVRKPQTS